jgi:hypothetical protein
MKAPALLAKILLLLIFPSMVNAGQLNSYQERIIMCMLPLEHADAKQLAEPWLHSFHHREKSALIRLRIP